MSDAESNARRLARARPLIDGFEARNPYQKELHRVLVAMMNYMERVHCTPPRSVPRRRGRPARPKAESREFNRWMGILHGHWRVLISPEMTGRRARRVMTKLLGSAT